MFQFVIKMGMVTVLAVFAVRAVGGIDAHESEARRWSTPRAARRKARVLNFVPDLNSAWMPMITFLVYISMNWWSTWYPGAEPGGGGYIAQRMFSAKDEKNSLLATLWFNIAHYAAAAVAVDSGRARVADSVSRPGQIRKPATSA